MSHGGGDGRWTTTTTQQKKGEAEKGNHGDDKNDAIRLVAAVLQENHDM